MKMDLKGQRFNLTTFFFLYIAQSIPMSFFSTALQVLMRQDGFSLSQIALLQVIKLPWILKFLWSPLVDRYCMTTRGYKHFIFASELCYAVLILGAGLLKLETDFYLIMLLVVLSLVASGTQDIATDSLAVLSFRKEGRSMVNSMQSMGSFGGSLFGSGVLLYVLHSYGWNVVLPCLSIFVMLAILPLMINGKLKIEEKELRTRARLHDFALFFANRKILRQVGFLILFYSSIIGILSVVRPFLVDLGYGMKEIGFMSGIVGTGTAFVASFAAGIIVQKIGIYKSRVLFAHLAMLTALYFVVLSMCSPLYWAVLLGIMMVWACYGMCTIVVYTTAMQYVRKGKEGTDFTVQTVITHLSSILVTIMCGHVAEMFGYTILFAVTVVLAAVTLNYNKLVFKHEDRRPVEEV